VHIICSPTELSIDFKQEPESGIIELEGDDLTTLGAVLRYLYGFDYTDGADPDYQVPNPFLTSFGLFMLWCGDSGEVEGAG
jgi:hypothetical protein